MLPVHLSPLPKLFLVDKTAERISDYLGHVCSFHFRGTQSRSKHNPFPVKVQTFQSQNKWTIWRWRCVSGMKRRGCAQCCVSEDPPVGDQRLHLHCHLFRIRNEHNYHRALLENFNSLTKHIITVLETGSRFLFWGQRPRLAPSGPCFQTLYAGTVWNESVLNWSCQNIGIHSVCV